MDLTSTLTTPNESRRHALKQYGVVKGRVSPAEANAVIFVIDGNDTVGATLADNEGNFLVDGIGEGEYWVLVMPERAYPHKEIRQVRVLEHRATDLGEVRLSP